jgi:hypothetical protein
VSDAGPGTDGGAAELVVGTAGFDGLGFVEVTDGQDAELVPGSQGGFHVWVNLRVHKAMGTLIVEREARRVRDGRLVLRAVPRNFEVPEEAMLDWWSAEEAAPGFMCPSPLGVNIIGEEIEFTVRLLDQDEHLLAEDSMIVVPFCNTQPEFCQEICSG